MACQGQILQGERVAFAVGIGGAAVVASGGVLALGSGAALPLGRLLLAALAGVGESAGLGALAAVAASASHDGGEQALARVADAEGAVDEDLYLQGIARHGVGQVG